MRLSLIACQSPGSIDAIRDHTYALAAALRAGGAEVDLLLRTPEGGWIGEPDDGPPLSSYDLVVVQYNPFMWGRRGFAPWLVPALFRLRRARPRPRIALMIHEPFVPMTGWRWMLMGLWQRFQLAALRVAADVVLVSIEAWTRRFADWWPRRPTRQLAVGSNFPDRSAERERQRRRLGADADRIVVATVDTGGATRLSEFVSAAVRGLGEAGWSPLLLVLGAGAALPPGLPLEVEALVPGRLEPHAFGAYLAAADVFLAPYVDGVSARRGALMAALQHGVAVVGTRGRLTDSVLRSSKALLLEPVGQPDAFVDAVVRLAASPKERAALGAAGRDLYLQRFDWPVLAAELLEGTRPTSRS